MEPTNLGRVCLVPAGEYDVATEYEYLDLVYYNGVSYCSLKTQTGVTPENDGVNWQQVYQPLYAEDLEYAVGSPADVYANLSALNAADPDHSKIYITLDDGKWCYYNGSAFVAGGVYQATAIADDSVSIKHTDAALLQAMAMRAGSGVVNYFDTTNPGTAGYYCHNNGSTGLVAHASYMASKPIYVKPGEEFILSEAPWGGVTDNAKIVFYDGTDTAIGAANAVDFTVPTGAHYFRFTIDTTFDYRQLMVVAGSSVPEEFVPFGVKSSDIGFINSSGDVAVGDLMNASLMRKLMYEKAGTLNYYDHNSAEHIDGVYCTGSGTGFGSSASYKASPPIYGRPGETWTLSGAAWGAAGANARVAFYNKAGLPINAANAVSFVVPNGTDHFRFTIDVSFNTLTLMVVRSADVPGTYIPYDDSLTVDTTPISPLNGKVWNCFGDSITEMANNYCGKIVTATGAIATNYGDSGRAVALRGGQTDIDYPPAVTDYVNMADGADIISVFCGTNDYGSQVALGTIASASQYEFYGALNTLAEGLIAKFPGKTIVFITPMQRGTTGDGRSIPLVSYVNAVKEVGAKYGIPTLDLYANCGLYPNIAAINTAFFVDADGLHPNSAGQDIIAAKIQRFLESLVI